MTCKKNKCLCFVSLLDATTLHSCFSLTHELQTDRLLSEQINWKSNPATICGAQTCSLVLVFTVSACVVSVFMCVCVWVCERESMNQIAAHLISQSNGVSSCSGGRGISVYIYKSMNVSTFFTDACMIIPI